jgi:hypothetical protein
MSAKVYVLLDLVHADSDQMAQVLRGKDGVALVEVLEGPPDLLMVIKAAERQKAAEYLMHILDSVDGMLENLRVLPVRKSTEKKPYRDCVDGQNMKRNLKEEMASHV